MKVEIDNSFKQKKNLTNFKSYKQNLKTNQYITITGEYI